MTWSGEYRGPQGEDVVFRAVNESPYFADEADGPVDYVAVMASGDVLGYLWWNTAQRAADFEPVAAAGGRAQNAAVRWNQELALARSRGADAGEAVRGLMAGPGLGQWGRVDNSSAGTAQSVEAVRSRAARLCPRM